MKRIVILNVYGTQNIGDNLICVMALKAIDKLILSTDQIILLSANPLQQNKSFTNYISSINSIYSPYGIAIKSNVKTISNYIKIYRFFYIILISLYYIILGKINNKFLPKKGIFSYITEIYYADVVIGMGGGYLRTKNKTKDNFGFLLTVLPIFIAKVYNKKILSLPMSFGPFSSNLQKRIAFKSLENTTVLCRENISFNLLNKMDVNKKIIKKVMPDLAFLYKWESNSTSSKLKSDYIILTARNWFSEKYQLNYESTLKLFVEFIWHKYGLKTIFVSMVHNKIEEDDTSVARRILSQIKNKKIFKISSLQTVEELQKLLLGARASVCTRMHSTITSIISYTPFISLEYEYKALGVLQSLNLDEWNININELSLSLLKNKMNKLMDDDNYFIYIKKIHLIQNEMNLFSSNISKEIYKHIYEK